MIFRSGMRALVGAVLAIGALLGSAGPASAAPTTAVGAGAARPATVGYNITYDNIGSRYGVGMVKAGSTALGYDYVLRPGETGYAVGFYNPVGVCTRVYVWRFGWEYHWTATSGSQYLAGSDPGTRIGLVRIAC